MSTGGGPKVGAVVVTYMRPGIVDRTLAAVAAQSITPVEVVVVDNGADDDLSARIAASGGSVRYVRSPENLGFSYGLASGMRAMSQKVDYFWLLDDDSPPAQNALAEAIAAAWAHPDCGVVANRGGHLKFGRIRHDLTRLESPQAADFALLDGSLVSADAVRAAGFPREDLFMMMEDVEYTTRIAATGLGIVVRPADESEFLHLGSAAPWRGYYQSRNHLRIALDRRSLRWVWGWLVRELSITAHLVTRRRWHAIALRLAGARDGLRGRMGRTITA